MEVFMCEDDEIMLAYVAGLIDGDGSIFLSKTQGKKTHSPTYKPYISLHNSNKGIIDFLHSNFPGRYHERKSYVDKKGCQKLVSHLWRLEGRVLCLNFINKVGKYLTIKKDRAFFLKEFIEEQPENPGTAGVSKELSYQREKSFLAMKEFNARKSSTDKFTNNRCLELSDDPKVWSYIAGLMDTDGSFSIGKVKPSIKRQLKNPTYSSYVVLTLTDVKAINFMKENVPYGNISVTKAKTATAGYCYRWELRSGDHICDFINRIEKYMRVKKEQALVLKEFCENKTPVKHCRMGFPNEELEFRELCHQKIKQLNKYGVYKPSLIDLEDQKLVDRAEDESCRERLNEMGLKEYAKV